MRWRDRAPPLFAWAWPQYVSNVDASPMMTESPVTLYSEFESTMAARGRARSVSGPGQWWPVTMTQTITSE